MHNALINGKLKKPKICELCGLELKLESHHSDYSKPLDVIWICDKCHKTIHKELRKKERLKLKTINKK